MRFFRVLVALFALLAMASADVASYNTRVGAKFLEEKATEEGVIKTDSGLLYKILKQGEGATPTKSDSVKVCFSVNFIQHLSSLQVHYAGTLIDGKEFDSSYARNSPATFGVTQVIAGWTEALQLMQEGSIHELYIPSDLAYGSRGAGRLIGPNSTLIFKVELLEVIGKKNKADL